MRRCEEKLIAGIRNTSLRFLRESCIRMRELSSIFTSMRTCVSCMCAILLRVPVTDEEAMFQKHTRSGQTKQEGMSMSRWQDPSRQRKKHLALEAHSPLPHYPHHFSFISPLFCRFQQCLGISANSSYCPHLFCKNLLSNRLFFLRSFNKSEFIDVYWIQGADNNIDAHFLRFSLLVLGI